MACFQKVKPSLPATFWEARFSGPMMAIDAGGAHDASRGQLDHRLLAERDRPADRDHVVESVAGLPGGEDRRVEHHEVLVAEQLDEPAPVRFLGRADEQTRRPHGRHARSGVAADDDVVDGGPVGAGAVRG
jgi:hypothetical protein